MTGPGWRLSTLLELARRAEASARAALALAREAEALRSSERSAAAEAVRAHRALAADAARRGPGPRPLAASLATRALHAGSLAGEDARLVAALGWREAEAAQAARDAERCRRELGEARAAVRALEGMRDAWRRARAGARDRAEEDAADELVSARHRAGSWRDPPRTRS